MLYFNYDVNILELDDAPATLVLAVGKSGVKFTSLTIHNPLFVIGTEDEARKYVDMDYYIYEAMHEYFQSEDNDNIDLQIDFIKENR